MGTVRRATIAAASVGAVTALAVTVAGLVLARDYRPDLTRVWGDRVPAEVLARYQPSPWSDWHRILSGGVLVLAAGVAVLVAVSVTRDRVPSDRRGLVVGTTMLAVVAAVVTIATRSLVEWDQLGLWAVTTGDGGGYWKAAFDDEVRFVIVGGAEVDPARYSVALIAHLAAPVLAATGLGAVAVEERRATHDAAAPDPLPHLAP